MGTQDVRPTSQEAVYIDEPVLEGQVSAGFWPLEPEPHRLVHRLWDDDESLQGLKRVRHEGPGDFRPARWFRVVPPGAVVLGLVPVMMPGACSRDAIKCQLHSVRDVRA